jgi:hypothetical protein
LFTLLRVDDLLAMVLALRIQGLAMHLVSTISVWSIGGYLQQMDGNISGSRRLLATLAFAWNPLLLFEACLNAHADTTLLTLILLSIWFLARSAARSHTRSSPDLGSLPGTFFLNMRHVFFPSSCLIRRRRRIKQKVFGDTPHPGKELRPLHSQKVPRIEGPMGDDIDLPQASLAGASCKPIILAAAMLALATCLKINVMLLAPGLIFYTWAQGPVTGRFKRIVAVSATYLCIVVLLYAPFWQGGEILHTLSINPATHRSINSPADFVGHFYNAVVSIIGYPPAEPIGSPAEQVTHTLSLGIFLAIYALLCWRVIGKPERISTLRGMVGWMAGAWLIYCALGSPWFWPWYIVTFFGLFALLEAANSFDNRSVVRDFARLLSLSMFTIYCLNSWGPAHSFVPGLPGFAWPYLGGLCVWALPPVGAMILSRVRETMVNAYP